MEGETGLLSTADTLMGDGKVLSLLTVAEYTGLLDLVAALRQAIELGRSDGRLLIRHPLVR